MRRITVRMPGGDVVEGVDGGDIDLDEEVVLGRDGHRVTEAEVEALAQEAERVGPPSRG